ncbi:MAG: hypothetical protein ABSE69_20130, partial [Roseiarcus sp.]
IDKFATGFAAGVEARLPRRALAVQRQQWDTTWRKRASSLKWHISSVKLCAIEYAVGFAAHDTPSRRAIGAVSTEACCLNPAAESINSRIRAGIRLVVGPEAQSTVVRFVLPWGASRRRIRLGRS